jgi:hypothetical protein
MRACRCSNKTVQKKPSVNIQYMTQVGVWSTLLLYWWRDTMPRLQCIYTYIYILLKEKAFCVSIQLKKNIHTVLNLILPCFKSMTQVKVNLSSTLFLLLLLLLRLIFHYVHTWKKLLVVNHKMNRTSTCHTHCRMTSIMFKFRQTYSRLNEQANCKCML